MRDLRKLIGSPSALFTFEAAARLTNFTIAARELGVTQAAVSFSIKTLEKNLGTTLFERQHKKLKLTPSGERLYQDISLGLSYIEKSVNLLTRSIRHDHVTLSCSTAFASQWILPRLPDFRTQYPSIDLRIQTSDRDVDLISENISLGVRRGTGDWGNYDALKFADEILFPVCSPSYLSEHGPIKDLADLTSRRLIHLVEPHRPRPTWRDWFNQYNQDYQEEEEGELKLNEYSLVVQAAIGGQGLALGWAHIVHYALRQGLLVSPTELQWQTGLAFYIVTGKGRRLSDDAVKVRQWIIDAI